MSASATQASAVVPTARRREHTPGASTASRRLRGRSRRVITSNAMGASIHRTERLRRGLALFGIAALVGTTTLIACGGDDGGSADDDPLSTSGVYIPAEAAAQNPIAPGITPGTPGKDPPEPTRDGGSTPMDSGTPKPPDASTPDAT